MKAGKRAASVPSPTSRSSRVHSSACRCAASAFAYQASSVRASTMCDGIRSAYHCRIQSSSTTRPARRCLARSEEHTSELQSRPHLVCRLLLEKKKKIYDKTDLLQALNN